MKNDNKILVLLTDLPRYTRFLGIYAQKIDLKGRTLQGLFWKFNYAFCWLMGFTQKQVQLMPPQF